MKNTIQKSWAVQRLSDISMIRMMPFLFICILLIVSGCASLKQSEFPPIDCSKKLGACKEDGRDCVSLGIPEGATTCNVDCQAKVLRKLYAAGVSVSFHTGAPPFPLGCVGYRGDLGGTEEGAKCIAKALGYEFHSWGCNEDGWSYNVRTH